MRASLRLIGRILAVNLVLALTRVVTRTRDIDDARNLARLLVRDLALDRVGDSDFDLADASALTHRLARALDGARDLDSAQNLVGNLADDLTGALSGALNRAIDSELDLNSALNWAIDSVRARQLARFLQSTDDPARGHAVRRQRGAGQVAPTARRLLAAAAQLLPAADRTQYAEEFWSELWEIAHADGRRRAQLAYAARQVMSARRLRAELRVPQRRGAAP